ncbi:uncharacterized protein LOC132751173 [Ruditapes philippinarum]|uniref:uncharacterized protein LOC132751173 n=1 Tax=Ruditapes philippinarum TaxID=129788 RepID=UPI00295A89C0|nr:uncharacterized protein LOC132751173 [Ruditapes philippinarum]
MGDKYCRLATLLVEICPQPLRKLFLKYMYADTKFHISSLGAYLLARQKELLPLKSKKVINQEEWDLLFPKLGQADETTWDTTILALLITKLFQKQLKQSERDAIEEIRYIRNQLHHKADLSVSDADFDDLWKRLETATILLAKQITPIPQYAVDIKASIDDAMVNNLPKLGDTLRSWIPGIVKSLNLQISNLEDNMRRLKEITEENLKCSKESQTILEDSSVEKIGSSGRTAKRLKTCDNILISLIRMFKTTLYEKLPTDFETPPEVQSIKAKLLQNGHVVVTGLQGSRVLETALATVRDLPYNHERCVEIKAASDWRHVDREEVDLVLCTYPFGDFHLDYKKAADMNEILNSMYQATKPSAGKQPLYIVIVSDVDVFQKFTTKFQHKILAEVVSVCPTTSVEAPVDLTYPNTNTELDINPCNQNLLEAFILERVSRIFK